ncbi:hypothetical protein SDC9_207877 [bioreactor metagenome]|uniref:Uncharacterized protein n=1 Tax=bioreactor metagenome TaxID=1076179 RepID=A0A645JAL4_9ZZZZ
MYCGLLSDKSLLDADIAIVIVFPLPYSVPEYGVVPFTVLSSQVAVVRVISFARYAIVPVRLIALNCASVVIAVPAVVYALAGAFDTKGSLVM